MVRRMLPRRIRCLGRASLLALCLLAACGGSSPAPSPGPTGGEGAVDRGPTRIDLDADPNGLFWDAASGVLYIADDNNNRILSWTEEDGVSLAAGDPIGPESAWPEAIGALPPVSGTGSNEVARTVITLRPSDDLTVAIALPA